MTMALSLLASCSGTTDLTTVWAIGDLHADAHCARSWVRRTGLVRGLDAPPATWEWADPTAAVVFMGDHLDKGPLARSTLNFVRGLNERFGDERVSAILGNHEVNLLIDRGTPDGTVMSPNAPATVMSPHAPANPTTQGIDSSCSPFSLPAGHRYLNYAYASAHPGQYSEWVPAALGNGSSDASLARTLDLVHEALGKLYAEGAYGPDSVLMTPAGRASITRHVPAADRALVASELARWQAAYLEGVGPDTPEGRWLARRPLSVRVADTVFVHGGVRRAPIYVCIYTYICIYIYTYK